jgi:putative methionine-R-sulfoxide reductase with GAF domain
LDVGDVVAAALVIPIDGSVSGRVFRSGLASLCADVALDADFRAVPGTRTRSSLTIPVGPPDAVRAVINLEATWISAFSIRDYERMTELAASALVSFPGGSQG